eukprot:3179926-Pyramimonas_sp.AAC.1
MRYISSSCNIVKRDRSFAIAVDDRAIARCAAGAAAAPATGSPWGTRTLPQERPLDGGRLGTEQRRASSTQLA